MARQEWTPDRVAALDQRLAAAHSALAELVESYGQAVAVHGDITAFEHLGQYLIRMEPGVLVTTVLAAVTRLHAQKAAG